MDHKLKADKSSTNRNWYCPNGHSLIFTEYAADRLQRELDRTKQQIARVEDEKREAERRADLAEKREKRLKKRASAGTCPCCQRTFSNMSEHMKHEHPEFVEAEGANVVPIKRSKKT
jgi:hypothetical protein